MESLNLHTLAKSLPTAQQNAEKELANNFKAAALSITTLYRSSRKNSKRAYNAGYAAACQDLLTMIQQGVSLHPGTPNNDTEEGGMTIGRVMDWTEARLEAIRAREEEEDEEEEREKEKEEERSKPSAPAPVPVPKSDTTKHPKAASTSNPRLKDQNPPAHSPRSQPHGHLPPSELSSSPLPPPPPTLTALRPIQRHRSRPTTTKGELTASHTNPVSGAGLDTINTGISNIPPPFTDIPIPLTAGAKRRHAMMMMLDSSAAATPVPIGSSSTPPMNATGNVNGSAFGAGNHGSTGSLVGRRRTRGSKSLGHAFSQNQNFGLMQSSSEAMDVEEDGGRERKRVARR